MSWALIAQSAITGKSNYGGIMAASKDICEHIDISAEGDCNLFVFPGYLDPAGFYLWEGKFEDALTGEGVTHVRLGLSQGQYWIDKNGEAT